MLYLIIWIILAGLLVGLIILPVTYYSVSLTQPISRSQSFLQIFNMLSCTCSISIIFNSQLFNKGIFKLIVDSVRINLAKTRLYSFWIHLLRPVGPGVQYTLASPADCLVPSMSSCYTIGVDQCVYPELHAYFLYHWSLIPTQQACFTLGHS